LPEHDVTVGYICCNFSGWFQTWCGRA